MILSVLGKHKSRWATGHGIPVRVLGPRRHVVRVAIRRRRIPRQCFPVDRYRRLSAVNMSLSNVLLMRLAFGPTHQAEG